MIDRQLHKRIVIPAMSYSLEMASLPSAQEQKLEVAETRMSKYDISASRKFKIRNENTWQMLGIEERFHWPGLTQLTEVANGHQLTPPYEGFH